MRGGRGRSPARSAAVDAGRRQVGDEHAPCPFAPCCAAVVVQPRRNGRGARRRRRTSTTSGRRRASATHAIAPAPFKASRSTRPSAVGSGTPARNANVGATSAGDTRAGKRPLRMPFPSRKSGTRRSYEYIVPCSVASGSARSSRIQYGFGTTIELAAATGVVAVRSGARSLDPRTSPTGDRRAAPSPRRASRRVRCSTARSVGRVAAQPIEHAGCEVHVADRHVVDIPPARRRAPARHQHVLRGLLNVLGHQAPALHLLGNRRDAMITGQREHVTIAAETRVEPLDERAERAVEVHEHVFDLAAARPEVVPDHIQRRERDRQVVRRRRAGRGASSRRARPPCGPDTRRTTGSSASARRTARPLPCGR